MGGWRHPHEPFRRRLSQGIAESSRPEPTVRQLYCGQEALLSACDLLLTHLEPLKATLDVTNHSIDNETIVGHSAKHHRGHPVQQRLALETSVQRSGDPLYERSGHFQLEHSQPTAGLGRNAGLVL